MNWRDDFVNSIFPLSPEETAARQERKEAQRQWQDVQDRWKGREQEFLAWLKSQSEETKQRERGHKATIAYQKDVQSFEGIPLDQLRTCPNFHTTPTPESEPCPVCRWLHPDPAWIAQRVAEMAGLTTSEIRAETLRRQKRDPKPKS